GSSRPVMDPGSGPPGGPSGMTGERLLWREAVCTRLQNAKTRAMSLLVKICGLKSPDAFDAALDGGADLVGLVFFSPSPRHVDPAAAQDFARRIGSRAGKVALTVDGDDALFDAIMTALRPDMLQLHGKEPPIPVAEL